MSALQLARAKVGSNGASSPQACRPVDFCYTSGAALDDDARSNSPAPRVSCGSACGLYAVTSSDARHCKKCLLEAGDGGSSYLGTCACSSRMYLRCRRHVSAPVKTIHAAKMPKFWPTRLYEPNTMVRLPCSEFGAVPQAHSPHK